MQHFKRWKWILAFVGVLAFAGAVGHESLHVEDAPDCKICHVQRHDPASLPVSVAAVICAAVFFGLPAVSFRSFADPVRSAYSGRAPPALLS